MGQGIEEDDWENLSEADKKTIAKIASCFELLHRSHWKGLASKLKDEYGIEVNISGLENIEDNTDR